MKQVSLPFAVSVAVLMFLAGLAIGTGAARSRTALQLPVQGAAQAIAEHPGQESEPMEQGASGPFASPVSARVVAPDENAVHLIQMRERLREIVMLEEVQYADMATYTQDLSKLTPQRSPNDTVNILFRYAGRDGWVADASHPALPGRTCVIYVGDAARLPASAITARDGLRPPHPAEVACDE